MIKRYNGWETIRKNNSKRELILEEEKSPKGWSKKIFFGVILLAIMLECIGAWSFTQSVSVSFGLKFGIISIIITIIAYPMTVFLDQKEAKRGR